MKIKFLILFVLSSFLCVSAADAQIVDVRAYSRQRGFRAYQPRQAQAPQRVAAAGQGNAARSSGQAAFSGTDNSGNPESARKASADEQKKSDQTDEMQKYIADNPHVRPDI